MEIKVEDLLSYVGGNTKVIIGNCSNSNNRFYEIWRGKVDELNFNNIPCGYKFIQHITIAEDEDWLQVWF